MSELEALTTHAPWRVSPTGEFIWGPHGERLATMGSDSFEADGSLIAAAPELLAVAQSVVYVHEHSGSNAQFVLRGLVDDARAAIAKARGETVPS